jgi:hypothetical protein
MNALGFVALVVAVFFVIGIGVGVIAVIALSVTRRNRAARWAQLARRARWRETERRGPQGAGDEIGYDEDDYDDTRPQWPDTGYRA